MKKLVFLFSFVLMAGMVSAQKCDKSSKKCCAKKAGATATLTEVGNPTAGDVSFVMAEADAAAEANEAVEKRVCEKSGTVAYYQKAVCAKSGKESWTEVEYCSKSKAFKEVAQVEMKVDEAQPADESSEGGTY